VYRDRPDTTLYWHVRAIQSPSLGQQWDSHPSLAVQSEKNKYIYEMYKILIKKGQK